MSKETIIVVLLVIIAFLGGAFFSKNSGSAGNTATPTTDPNTAQTPETKTVNLDQIKNLFNDKNIVFGDKNSKLLFVEFSDPSCPYCHVAAGKNPELNKKIGDQFLMTSEGGTYVAPGPEMKKLVDQGKAAFVWLYADGHGNGELATQALYCAYEAGKFWQVHDKLMTFDGYDLMNNTVKNDVAKSGVMADFLKGAMDAKTLKSCLDGGKYANRAAEDMATVKQFGFNGTPDFYVNTTNYVGAYSFKEMQSVVDAALK